jgi:hypothetical protein
MSKDKFLHMRVSGDFLDKIEDWRAGQRPIPSFAEAVRILIERQIESERKGKKR